jgi:hypothetical protein
MHKLEPNLIQDPYQQFIHIVANSYRDLDELGTICTCKAFAI